MRSAVRQLPLRLSIQRLSLRPTLRLPIQRKGPPRDQRQHPRLQPQRLRRHRCVVIPLLSLTRTLSLTHCLSPSHLPPPPISHIDDDGGHVRAVGGADYLCAFGRAYLWAFGRADNESDCGADYHGGDNRADCGADYQSE